MSNVLLRVRELMIQNPGITSEELSNQIEADFPKWSPTYLRGIASRYRSRIKRESTPDLFEVAKHD